MTEAERPQPPDEVLEYYALGLEDRRLGEGKGPLERARTEELLARYLPPVPAVVLDVGGGTGHYALWLAARGFTVHLVEAVPLHLELAGARSAAQAHAPLASIVQGDARHLEWPPNAVDAVVLLGPLYHLTTATDRLDCLREAWRVLRPGGRLIAALISRFASTLDGLISHLFEDPHFASIAWEDLERGLHHGIGEKYFTTAYLHHPADIQLLAIEGPGWLLQDFESQWAKPASRQFILEAVRRTERERTMLGASSH